MNAALDRASAAVGILYVHGIGAQKKGEVASAFAEACHSWLRDRIHGIGQGHANRGTTRETLQSVVPQAAQIPVFDASRGDLRQHLAFLKAAHKFIPEAQLVARGQAAIPALEGEPLLATAELVAVPSQDAGTPTAFRLELDWTDARGQQHASDWLLAECWWADKCAAPSIWQLLAWAPRAVPATIAAHLFGRVEDDQYYVKNKWLRLWLDTRGLLYSAALVFAAIFLIPLFYVGVIIIGICSWLPIPHIKVIGDAFAFSELSAQHSTILGSVQQDLDWLAERCASIVIVGHSQGAMLAYLACRQRADKVQKLITLGSGIRKLRALAGVTERADFNLRCAEALLAWANFAGISAWISLAFGLTGQVSTVTMIVGALVGGGVAAFFGLIGFVLFAGKALREAPEDRFWEERIMRHRSQSIKKVASSAAAPIMWLDFVATRDPVAAGATYSRISFNYPDEAVPTWPPSFPTSTVTVTNAGSLLFDHTSYLKNRDECIAAIVHEAGTLDGMENLHWLVPDFLRSRAVRWVPATPTTPISIARARIVARASLASRVFTVVVFALIAFRFAGGLPAPTHWAWSAVWSAMGLTWQDLGLAIVLISAWVGVRAARTHALQRLARAVFERRNWCAERDSDGTLRLVDNAFNPYGRISLGESLGLAVSIFLPAIVFALAQAAGGPTAVTWTLVAVAVAHMIAALLRLHDD
jgi:pimeloyl-ACP methyl ester carboxylesterase